MPIYRGSVRSSRSRGGLGRARRLSEQVAEAQMNQANRGILRGGGRGGAPVSSASQGGGLGGAQAAPGGSTFDQMLQQYQQALDDANAANKERQTKIEGLFGRDREQLARQLELSQNQLDQNVLAIGQMISDSLGISLNKLNESLGRSNKTIADSISRHNKSLEESKSTLRESIEGDRTRVEESLAESDDLARRMSERDTSEARTMARQMATRRGMMASTILPTMMSGMGDRARDKYDQARLGLLSEGRGLQLGLSQQDRGLGLQLDQEGRNLESEGRVHQLGLESQGRSIEQGLGSEGRGLGFNLGQMGTQYGQGLGTQGRTLGLGLGDAERGFQERISDIGPNMGEMIGLATQFGRGGGGIPSLSGVPIVQGGYQVPGMGGFGGGFGFMGPPMMGGGFGFNRGGFQPAGNYGISDAQQGHIDRRNQRQTELQRRQQEGAYQTGLAVARDARGDDAPINTPPSGGFFGTMTNAIGTAATTKPPVGLGGGGFGGMSGARPEASQLLQQSRSLRGARPIIGGQAGGRGLGRRQQRR